MQPISEAWWEAAQRCGDKYGVPLPKEVLEIGDPEKGWGVRFNASREPVDSIPPMSLLATHRGTPAGVIDQSGGTVLAGSEDELVEWLKSLAVTGG